MKSKALAGTQIALELGSELGAHSRLSVGTTRAPTSAGKVLRLARIPRDAWRNSWY